VVALGTGKVKRKGKKVDFNREEGSKSLFRNTGGTESKSYGKLFLIMREEISSASFAKSNTQLLTTKLRQNYGKLNNYLSMNPRGTTLSAVGVDKLARAVATLGPSGRNGSHSLFSTRHSAAHDHHRRC